MPQASSTRTLSVSEYAALIGRALRAVGPAALEGEVQRPSRSSSGMLWFSLTDGEAVLPCKVFRSQVAALEHEPKEGDLVVVAVDRPDLWSQAGKLDLIVSQVRLAGEGELLRRREELIARLRAEGLCDPERRRALPRFPRAVGVIAGAGSDALADVIRALRDRWPAADILTCPSLVQGKAAPLALIDALARLQEHPRVDVVIIARGGGSVADLACFDDERLARAIFASALPVVCAVGHTENNPVCNHVAWAAYTPSRSAELVVPAREEILREIAHMGASLRSAAGRVPLLAERVESLRRQVAAGAALGHRLALLRESAAPLRTAQEHLARLRETTVREGERLARACRRQLADHERDYGQALARLLRESSRDLRRRLRAAGEELAEWGQALPVRTRRALARSGSEALALARLISAQDFRRRGWVLAHRADRPLRSACELHRGEEIDLTFRDGSASAAVRKVNVQEGQRGEGEGRAPGDLQT